MEVFAAGQNPNQLAANTFHRYGRTPCRLPFVTTLLVMTPCSFHIVPICMIHAHAYRETRGLVTHPRGYCPDAGSGCGGAGHRVRKNEQSNHRTEHCIAAIHMSNGSDDGHKLCDWKFTSARSRMPGPPYGFVTSLTDMPGCMTCGASPHNVLSQGLVTKPNLAMTINCTVRQQLYNSMIYTHVARVCVGSSLRCG